MVILRRKVVYAVRGPSSPLNVGREEDRELVRVLLSVGVVVGVIVAAVAVIVGLFLVGHTGPSSFAPAGMARALPGTPACRQIHDEICYEVEFQSGLQGLTLAHLRFVVASGSEGASTNGPLGPRVPLGQNASVSVLGSPTSVAGVWNFSASSWTSGASWAVPIGPYVPVVLDTGLLSNSTLQEAEFAIILTSPYEGALGFPLYCAGC